MYAALGMYQSESAGSIRGLKQVKQIMTAYN